MIRKIGFALLAVLVVGATFWILHTRQAVKQTALSAKLDQVVSVTHEPVLDCAQIAAQRPFVILALGQSNAGNHGEPTSPSHAPVMLFADGKCIMGTDPLPGSTGSGGSIWSRLPHNLLTTDLHRPVVLSVMGIDATLVADWTSDQSPLRQRLTDRVKSMKALGLLPQVILWQQGEADSRMGTTGEAYKVGLDRLAAALTQAGSDAPIVTAYSTVCHSTPAANIRTAITAQSTQKSRFKVGPDTDSLNDATMRFDKCHFSAHGLDHAAALWAKALQLIFASI